MGIFSTTSCRPTRSPLSVFCAFSDHIEYIRDFIGVDYVGVSGDFDGLVK